jgi:hypothetical protein
MYGFEDAVKEFQSDGRICPLPEKWNQLWQMLPNRQRRGMGWEPAPPLILAAWQDAPHLSKMLRFREHLEWASKHSALPEVCGFLRSLKPEDWYKGV